MEIMNELFEQADRLQKEINNKIMPMKIGLDEAISLLPFQDFGLMVSEIAEIYMNNTSVGEKIHHLYVYIIRMGQEPGTVTIKVGIANNLKRRLQELQTGNPENLSIDLSLLLEYKIAKKFEREVHGYLSVFHKKNEWFIVPTDTYMIIKMLFDSITHSQKMSKLALRVCEMLKSKYKPETKIFEDIKSLRDQKIFDKINHLHREFSSDGSKLIVCDGCHHVLCAIKDGKITIKRYSNQYATLEGENITITCDFCWKKSYKLS